MLTRLRYRSQRLGARPNSFDAWLVSIAGNAEMREAGRNGTVPTEIRGADRLAWFRSRGYCHTRSWHRPVSFTR